MSFAFNFVTPSGDGSDGEGEGMSYSEKQKEADTQDNNADKKEANAILAREVRQFCSHELLSKFRTTEMEFGEHCIKVVDTSEIEKLIVEDDSFKSFANSKDLSSALSSNSDLVAGVYEGGLKVWECGMDMTEFLSSHSIGKTVEIKGKRVIELGCGAGLPGVYCCTRGAHTVDFQDYNEEVLQLLTQNNVAKNTLEGDTPQSRYFCGDWSSLSQLLKKENLMYDIILSAETIYNVENYSSLHSVFDSALTDTGIIIVSAKVYYFGVGGSIDAFTEYVDSQKCFTVDAVHTIQAGVPRKVLMLRRRGKS